MLSCTTLHRCPHGVDERPLDLGSGGGAAGVHDARQRVPALPRQLELAVRIAVEGGAESDELVHAGRALVDEHPHGVDVAEPGAGGQRVGQVEVRGVGVAAEHGGHPALRPARGGLLELGLGEDAHPHAVQLRGADGGRQPGHAGAQHEQVEIGHQEGLQGSRADRRGDPGAQRRVWRRAAQPRPSIRLPPGPTTSLLDVDVAVGRGALLLGGDELGREGVDRLVGAVDVHDGGLVALELGCLVLGVGDDDHSIAG